MILVVLTVGLVRGTLRDRGERDTNTGVELIVYRREQVGISVTALPMSLPLELINHVKSVPGVAAVTPVGQHLEMKGQSGFGIRQIDGVEYEGYTSATKVRIVEGEPLPASGDAVIVDVRYAAIYKIRPGVCIDIFGREFKVTGIYAPETGARNGLRQPQHIPQCSRRPGHDNQPARHLIDDVYLSHRAHAADRNPQIARRVEAIHRRRLHQRIADHQRGWRDDRFDHRPDHAFSADRDNGDENSARGRLSDLCFSGRTGERITRRPLSGIARVRPGPGRCAKPRIAIQSVAVTLDVNNVARYYSLLMIKTFRCKDTEKVFNRNPVKRWPKAVRRTARRMLLMIDAADTIDDLRVPPSNHLEKLKGDRMGQFSIRVNDQWRVCFHFLSGDAYDVEIVDYH